MLLPVSYDVLTPDLTLQWNFEKFLVDKEGKVVNRWASTTAPSSLEKDVEKLL